MAESFGSEFTFVEVTADDGPKKELWVALAKPSQALTLVLSEVPEGWTAEIVNDRLTTGQLNPLANLRLKPGEVRKLTK
jgi:hypothetical protein